MADLHSDHTVVFLPDTMINTHIFSSLYDKSSVPSTAFLDRRFDAFVATDLDALVESSVLKKGEQTELVEARHSSASRFTMQMLLEEEQRGNRTHQPLTPHSSAAQT